MLETQCIVNGKHLKVRYRKQFEKGDAYKGIIFSKSTIPFYCYALNDKLLLFEPRSLDQSLKNAIFGAIKSDQLLKKSDNE